MNWRPPVYAAVVLLLVVAAVLEIREGAAVGDLPVLALLLVVAGLLGAIGGWVAGRRTEAMETMPEAAYAELDEMRVQLAELQERLDFSERLLAQAEEQRGILAARTPEPLA